VQRYRGARIGRRTRGGPESDKKGKEKGSREHKQLTHALEMREARLDSLDPCSAYSLLCHRHRLATAAVDGVGFITYCSSSSGGGYQEGKVCMAVPWVHDKKNDVTLRSASWTEVEIAYS